LIEQGQVIEGVRLGVAAAGIKRPGRSDVLLMEGAPASGCAAVFTRNQFAAAPVEVARRHLASGSPRYLLVNSGNANAGLGERGVLDAEACCRAVADRSGCSSAQVLPFSTGVIGEPFPVSRLVAALPDAFSALRDDGWSEAARAIMTTDTVPKLVSCQGEIDGETVTVTGMAKGAGMICPDMATMLAFIATDAQIEPALLETCLSHAVTTSFNRITVDGDTSTNDACVLVATGRRAARVTGLQTEAYRILQEMVSAVCRDLARRIVKDGEGATKLVEIRVEDASTEEEARTVAYTIAHSPLVKTALFASDPNWGRLLAAVGRAGITGLDISRVGIYLDDVCVVHGGARAPQYTEQAGQAVMSRSEFLVRVALGRGRSRADVLTCDLSYDYVRINADYRT